MTRRSLAAARALAVVLTAAAALGCSPSERASGDARAEVDQHLAARALGLQMRVGADTVELAGQRAAQRVAGIDREQLELDARRAGIDDEDVVGHGAQPATGCFSRLLWA